MARVAMAPASMEGSSVQLSFERVHYTVSVKGSALPKALLTDVKGEVASGHVLAILGPSGAGKTTLLNTLTLQKSGGTPSGHVRVNGEPLTLALYDRICAYVEQVDALWAPLTVREHLEYAISLFRGNSLDAEAQKAAVDELISAVGLEDFADVRAGNEIIRGLSSGNKRRLSVALALVKQPSIMFLDEPTSGMDSASAIRIMSFLKKIAASSNIAVVCTIHQPPASVFAGFDNAMILSMGRVAYFGKAAKLGEYLASIGSPPAEGTNVAEFVLDLVNKDFTPVSGITKVLDKWAERDGAAYGVEAAEGQRADDRPLNKTGAAQTGFMKQLGVLTDRSIVVAKREPLAYLVRLAANFFATIFFGIIYIKTRDKEQGQINSRTFFLMFCMGIPMQFILVSNFIYHYQWLSLKREVKDGMYHPAASAIASWIVQAPMMFVLALSSLIPMYAFGDLYWGSFPIVLVLYAVTFWAFEGLAQAMSTFSSVIMGLFGFLNLYFIAFLFCGMFVDPEDVIWPIRVFCYFLPLGWSLQSYMYALYHDLPAHSGTMPCTPGEPLEKGGVCTAQGFYCWSESDPTGAVCYGKTGDQILNSLSVQFTIFGDESHYARNLCLIVAFGAFCRAGYVAVIYVLTKMYGGQEPVPPSDSFSVMVEDEEDEVGGSLRGGNSWCDVSKEEEEPALPVTNVAGATSGGADSLGKISFAFHEIAYRIPQKKGATAQVLERVSASVSNGEVLAIVGPSGSGKTILLDTLTFNKGPGTPTGKILLNGSPMTRAMFVKTAIYVPREDNLCPTLTPRQHLDFAFKMFQPHLDAAAREEAVKGLLDVTGMTSCQNTKAGGFLFKGLSGGQRRRLTLAIALVKQPRVLILDEPTSGLDSAAAAAITSLLSSIARRCSAAIVCTIHQPSAVVFAGFQKTLVLSEGRVAYCGDRGGMASYFKSINVPLSKDANPAEAVLDLVSKDTTSAESVSNVLDRWAASDKSKELAAAAASGSGSAVALGSSAAGGAMVNVILRQLGLALTDPLQYTGRLLAIPPIISFFGLVYVASHDSNQKQVPFRLFYLWWVLALPACLGIVTVIGTNRDTKSVVSEIRAGMYRAFSYVLSTSLVQIPFLILLGFAISVCSFAIGGWPWDNFITFVLMYSINLWAFDSLAQLLAVVFKSPVLAMLAYLGVWSTSIIFCGLVFRGGDVVWPFRLFYYMMPLKWLFNATGYDIYIPAEFSGAESCTPGTSITAEDGSVSICTDAGFYCEGATSSFGCWGRTGEQVLQTLHMTYESLESSDERLIDLGVLLGMVMALKIGYTVTLWRTVSASDSPH